MAAVTAPVERIDAAAPKLASADAILVVDDIVKRFETPDGVLTARRPRVARASRPASSWA